MISGTMRESLEDKVSPLNLGDSPQLLQPALGKAPKPCTGTELSTSREKIPFNISSTSLNAHGTSLWSGNRKQINTNESI